MIVGVEAASGIPRGFQRATRRFRGWRCGGRFSGAGLERRSKVGFLDRELVVIELLQKAMRCRRPIAIPSDCARRRRRPCRPGSPSANESTYQSPVASNGPTKQRSAKYTSKKREPDRGRALQGASRSPIGEEILKAEVSIGRDGCSQVVKNCQGDYCYLGRDPRSPAIFLDRPRVGRIKPGDVAHGEDHVPRAP